MHSNMNTNFIISSLPKYDDYIDCMVAFVDILGFDSLSRNIQSEDDFNKIGNLLYKLKETAKHFDVEDTLFRNLNVTAISDSVIFTMPFHDPNSSPTTLALILHWIQYMLLVSDEKLIRGYMTRGRVYHKDNIVFGMGYSEAYRKEKEIGHAPRIVIDPSLVKEAEAAILKANFPDHILNYIIQDSCDGYYFIDYLKPVGIQAEIKKEQRDKIKIFVQAKVRTYSDNEKILRKYNWLSNYFSLTDRYYE